jgi:hypothetical protein
MLESTSDSGVFSLRTKFTGNTAISEGTQSGKPISKTDPISPRTLILPNGFFGPHVALGRRLATMNTGDEVKAYLPPFAEVTVTVGATAAQTDSNRQLDARRAQLRPVVRESEWRPRDDALDRQPRSIWSASAFLPRHSTSSVTTSRPRPHAR